MPGGRAGLAAGPASLRESLWRQWGSGGAAGGWEGWLGAGKGGWAGSSAALCGGVAGPSPYLGPEGHRGGWAARGGQELLGVGAARDGCDRAGLTGLARQCAQLSVCWRNVRQGRGAGWC